jgi:hypothetical protein
MVCRCIWLLIGNFHLPAVFGTRFQPDINPQVVLSASQSVFLGSLWYAPYLAAKYNFRFLGVEESEVRWAKSWLKDKRLVSWRTESSVLVVRVRSLFLDGASTSHQALEHELSVSCTSSLRGKAQCHEVGPYTKAVG